MRLMVLPSLRSPLAPSSCCSSSPLHPDSALWAGDWGDSACGRGTVMGMGASTYSRGTVMGDGAVGQGNVTVGRHGGGAMGMWWGGMLIAGASRQQHTCAAG